MTNAALRLLDRIATLFAFVAGAAVLVLSLLIAFDVVARKVFGFSLQGTDEIGGYVLAMVGSLGMIHVLNRREFTRIDLIMKIAPVAVRRSLHVLAYISLAAMVVFFATHALKTLDETLLFQSRANTPLQTPMWIPQGLWATGMVFFAVMAVIHASRATILLFVAPEQIEKEYGTSGIEEEVEDYTGVSRSSPAHDDRGS
jgi:TRAP-type C4-dicarboxylate transport system permease small subunit